MAPPYGFKVNGQPITSDLLGGRIEDILRFLLDGVPRVSTDETLEVARFIDRTKAAIVKANH